LAEQAAQALLRLHPPRRGVLELYGTLNASDAREIARGCREALTAADLRVTYSLCGDGMRSRGYEILESLSEHLDEIGCIFAHNDAMARGAVDYLHEHGRVPGRDILVCSFGGGADMRALLNDGMVQVVAALDDETLAALTVEAARGTVRAPAARFTYFAPAAVLEGGAGHAGT
ncbi:MAG: substrate-binding domain-containing protein, partial [Collinsella intestinalis]|nr:substrate-binding domain-containing protein [Collinsella intestinalis]